MRLVKTTSTRAIALVLVVAALLAIGGCGGGDDSSDTAATQTTTGTAEAEKGSGANRQGQDGQDSKGEGGGQGNTNAPRPEGEREPGITPQQERKATTANIALESPGIVKSGAALSATTLSAKYTCDGENTWPALRWKGLPPEAEELVLMLLSVQPEEQKLLFDWAVAGLDPSLRSIEAGKLPDGAIVGENSFGKSAYNVCPSNGNSENYVFLLFAIPEALDPAPGFDAKELRKEVLAEHGNVGLLSASYQR